MADSGCFFGRPPNFPLALTAAVLAAEVFRPPMRPKWAITDEMALGVGVLGTPKFYPALDICQWLCRFHKIFCTKLIPDEMPQLQRLRPYHVVHHERAMLDVWRDWRNDPPR
jgi:hypothetical protein